MDSLAAIRSGDIAAALNGLKQEVRANPRDPRLRAFLFQLLCITGAWDRALTQLAMTAELDGEAIPMARTYRAAIRCEMLRSRVFAGATTPTIFGRPDSWMSLLVQANIRLAAGAEDEATTLRDAAFDAAPATAGRIDNQDFTWIADADPRLGPILEAFIDGKYYWVPFHRIATVEIEPPADLRDQAWLPARFTWANEGRSEGFIPTRYPGSAEAADPALALARRTEFAGSEEWPLGLGQRMLATDAGEHPLLDIRHIAITPA